MKYIVLSEHGYNGYVVQEHRTFKHLIKELIGNHYTNGAYSMCKVGNCVVTGFRTNSEKHYNFQDNIPVHILLDFIDWVNDENYTLKNFWNYCDYYL